MLKKINAIKPEQDVKVFFGKRERAKRSIGQALNVAITLSELSPLPSRIVTLIGGPCTHGIGKVIGINF